ncbi:MAG: diguanylate cyclase [Geobacteraceae bacterium GWC2_58_44]|nr:MAG: diguanylate cyclase [Geobacteraceae bacterium GWC2_58_44]
MPGLPPASPAMGQQPDPGQAARILVIDDSPTQAKLLEQVLTAHGYRVFVSKNGTEALVHILAHPPDLVISDIMMPEMDGFELCRRVRSVDAVKGLPIILLTNLNDPTDVLHSLEAGADYFISKPYNSTLLLSRVSATLQKGAVCYRERSDGEVALNYHGQGYAINASKAQVIDLLLGTYELAAEKNREFLSAQKSLKRLNEELENRVAERTAELAHTIEDLRLEIAERENAQECVRRLNRLHSVLSETNKAVVHTKDRDTLFHSFCRIAVETGSFKLARICLVGEERGELKILAAQGAVGYLDGIKISSCEEPSGSGPTGISIREGTYYICNDFLGASITRPWHERGRAHGIRASASIALRQEERVIGALTLYADKKDYFDGRQVELLRQMGADISFALDNIVREGRRLEAERALLEETAARLTEREQNAQKIEMLAHYDSLTNLPNRFSLMVRLSQALELSKRFDSHLAVILIDLDRFKNINDSLGHHIGDILLFQVAARLSETIRSADIVARLGGDEFVVVLPVIRSGMGAAHAGSKIQHSLSQTYRVEGHDLNVTPSIGISVFPQDGETVEELMKNADLAMYHAKSEGRNNYQFFQKEMHLAAQARLVLECDLRGAIEREEFLLHYQPQIHIATGRVVGVEALVRWQHPQRGLVPPDMFIPIAEETGLILPIGDLVLKTACRQLAAWLSRGVAPFRMAVNLSARQFKQGNLPGLVTEIITEAGIDPHLLELEITESAAMNDPAAAILHLRRLREMGVELAIDDFGTGYSSLSYLKLFPVNRLKIDRSFVKDIETDPDDSAIAAATIALAHTLGKEVVAEGVETETQLSFLRDQQCDIVQGYLISRPLPAAEMAEYLRHNHLGRGSRLP